MASFGLLRYQIFLAYGAVFMSMWYLAVTNRSEWENKIRLPAIATPVVDYAPLVGILAIALYALLSLVIGVSKFRDCPDAAKELETHVAQAEVELRKLGILLD